jgi:ABC-type antimicrobial peptide transport system permease subunit
MAFRSFVRNRDYTLINIFGLTAGITTAMVIFLIISFELSFDTFHRQYNSIFRVVHDTQLNSGISHSTVTPYPFAEAFRTDMPDVPLFTQLHYEEELLIHSEQTKQIVNNVIFADSLFFKVFDFEVLSGNPTIDLSQPGKIFLTRSLAEKIVMDGKNSFKIGNDQVVEVAGIIADPLPKSHIQFSMIVSMPTFSSEFIGGLPIDQPGMTVRGFSYLVLPENMDLSALERRLKTTIDKYLKPEDAARETYKLQSLQNLHFDEQYTFNPGGAANVQMKNLMATAAVGLLIIFIACINFVNMATAIAIKKSKEIGIRKTLGAVRWQIVKYFLAETLMITVCSVVIGFIVVRLALPWLNNFLEKELILSLMDPLLIIFVIGLILFVTVFSGLYPALVQSRFSPAFALKKGGAQIVSAGNPRKILVVFQFLTAQAMIIGTLIIADQMNYLKNKPLGFNKEAVVTVGLPDKNPQARELLRNKLKESGNIRSVSYSGGAPTSYNNFNTHYFLTEKGKEERMNGINIKPVDRHYLDTYQLNLLGGRWFSESDEMAIQSTELNNKGIYVFVINESSMRQLGFQNANEVLGKRITTGIMEIEGEIVGVVEDFHVASLHKAVGPVVMMNFPFLYFEVGIKISPGNIGETLTYLEKTWLAVYPESTFDYDFLDEHLAQLYRSEERTFTFFKIFAGISVLIVCMGLYALISFMAIQKTKEVGIRKVMGASVSNILLLFGKEFILLIMIASVISAPIVWYFMQQWLSGFVYHIDIKWSVLAIGIIVTTVLTGLTIGYRTAKAAMANPVETLRVE